MVSTFAYIAFPFAAFLFGDETNLIALCNGTKVAWDWQCNQLETGGSFRLHVTRASEPWPQSGKATPAQRLAMQQTGERLGEHFGLSGRASFLSAQHA
jgi:hypothetical protein